jgi:aminodeoxyfutalosine deaminase
MPDGLTHFSESLSSDRRSQSLAARWIFPIAAPPIENGVIEIEDGRILEVHSRSHSRTKHLGNVAVLPGLINAHTHLEFSNLGQPLRPAYPFPDWIAAVVSERKRRTAGIEGEDCVPDPIARGLRECFASGTAVVADISTGLIKQADDPVVVQSAIAQGRLRRFVEALSPTASGFQEAVAKSENLAATDDMARGVGISPHAPYTVPPALLRQLIELAVRHGQLVAMHLAETADELEFLLKQSGPLREMLDRRGLWDSAAQWKDACPLDILHTLSRAPRALVVHGNYLTTEEFRFLASQEQLSLVYCPRTHQFFGHACYPLKQALDCGVRVVLGTDSRASNPDLDLWEEAKTVARLFPEVPAWTVLRMVTLDSAIALGAESEYGSLAAGRNADLCCVSLDPGAATIAESLFGRSARGFATMHNGHWLRPAQPSPPYGEPVVEPVKSSRA